MNLKTVKRLHWATFSKFQSYFVQHARFITILLIFTIYNGFLIFPRPTGSWWFSSSPSGSDSNFLRVVSSFPNRRLSDNMLNTPKIRVAPSCASSPGSTPVGTGLPIRRHSNVERRGSTINLSPPSVIKVDNNTHII